MGKANDYAFQQLISADPILVDIQPAGAVLPGMQPTDFLHAGPPISYPQMCPPMQGAVVCALLNEGIAHTVEEARRMAADGTITHRTCHEFGAVGPMTGLTTWSMPVWVVEDRHTGRRSYANVSEGVGVGLRFGEYSPQTLQRLHWIRTVFMPVFAQVLKRTGGIELAPILAQGLAMGDELHMRNYATTSLFLKTYAHEIAAAAGADAADVLKFIGVGNDQFFLNLAMAANKLAADLADGVPGSTLVTALARNGVEVGVRISGLPGQWFTAPAPMVQGLYLPGYTQADANPDIGDSAIMEVGGFGGFAMVTAPAIVKFLGASDVSVAAQTTNSMYEITHGEHPRYQIPTYNFRGIPCGIDAAKVVETGITPILNTAIASNQAGKGMVGAGMSTLPLEPFVQAVTALAQHLGL